MPRFVPRPYNDPQFPHLRWVVNTKKDGKRSRRFFETKKEADTYAQRQQIEFSNQGLEGVSFPTALRIMAQEASDALAPYGKTIADAVAFYLPTLHASHRTATVDTAIQELLETKSQDGASKRYLGDLRSRLGQFAKDFGERTLGGITSLEIDGWLRSLKVARLTRKNFRRVVGTFFNFAMERGYCAGNPVGREAKIRIPQAAPGILTVEETHALLAAAPKSILAALAIGAFAGLRRAEIELLDWSRVNLAAGIIIVEAENAKARRRRNVTIRPNLAAWLQRLAKNSGRVDHPSHRKLLKKALTEAGIARWPSNALRHGFVSYALAHERDAAAIALEVGHNNTDLLFQHYRELVAPTDAARYWQIVP